MGNGVELYKNQLEGYKRSIENLKKEIAYNREVLKKIQNLPQVKKLVINW